ncbi:MAG: hypothetical protein H5T92_06235, partial [Synergistales bacterium]|nr:hypothetical protein [Synergistales bacterium]
PAISNIVLIRLDGRLGSYARASGVKFTRYADDMTFSGNEIGGGFFDRVCEIIEDEGFRINRSKSHLIFGEKKIVTGLSVSGKTVMLPRERKRIIRQKAHYISKYGIYDERVMLLGRDPLFVERLLGELAFWCYVEKENLSARKLLESVKKRARERYDDEYGLGSA